MPDEAVLDVEETLDAGGTAGDSGQDQSAESGASSADRTEEDPYSSKASREYSQWLKGLRESGDPNAEKFARLAKNNHGSMFALHQLDPKGIEGVRERYALLDSVIHNDPERGELKGAEAIAALQDSVREIGEIDARIVAGDAEALNSFDDEMKAGIVKMTPAILDMAKTMDPEGYASAVLPHFVEALKSSDLVSSYNAMVDVLEEKPPSWLTEQQKQAWQADQQRKVVSLAANMGAWLNAQARKAAELPTGKNVPRGTNGQPPKDSLSEREAKFNEREQEAHWNTNISPKLDQHASAEFQKLFAPYAKRLNLDAPTANALKMEFSKRVASAAAKDANYMGQIKRYRAMRNPDPGTVLNFAKVNFDKHAKTVMESLVNERYKPFLNAKTRGAAPTNGSSPAPAKGIQMVTVRPKDSDIDHRNRTLDQIHKKIFPLRNGKVVQLQA